MHWILIAVASAGMVATGQAPVAAQADCTIAPRIEVAGNVVTLADLFPSGTCRKWLDAAAEVALGTAPLAGSERVLDGRSIRERLQALPGYRPDEVTVPERIAVRSRGAAVDCDEIGRQVVAQLPGFDPVVPPGIVRCGLTGHIREAAHLEVTRSRWDPSQASWAVSVRCVPAADCVPFLVRLPGQRRAAEKAPLPAVPESRVMRRAAAVRPLVRPGQRVILCWERGGIRLVVRALCLDAGRMGQEIRVRLPGGAEMKAAVVSAELLRAVS